MLVQYAVENYKSIKDEIIINYRVDDKYKNSKWAIEDEDLNSLYSCIGLVGPNAAGKSNIVDSLVFSLRFIVNTIKRKDSSPINVTPFAFAESYKDKPTTFEFIFYKEKVKYIYGFSVNSQEVLEEYLMGYFTSRAKTIFERSRNQQYKFKGNDEKIQKEIAKKTNANRLYMPVAAEWGYEPAKKVYEWFEFITRQYSKFNITFMIGEIIKNEERKKMLLSELKKADFNIKDIYIKNKKMNQKSLDFIEKLLGELLGENEEIDLSDETPLIRIVHENCDNQEFDVDLDEDSTGTRAIVSALAEFLYLSENGGLMLEDELGKTYHTKLTQHFLEMLRNRELNPGKLQLLFTTHNTQVLKILNPDQVYLVDKDDFGGTVLTLLGDYAIKEEDDVELGYLKGRYGSVPYMKG